MLKQTFLRQREEGMADLRTLGQSQAMTVNLFEKAPLEKIARG
jgi:hypothetical protein